MRVRRVVFSAAYGMALLALAGCGTGAMAGVSGSGGEPQRVVRTSPVGKDGAAGLSAEVDGESKARAGAAAGAALPGVGAETLAKIPANARQVVLVTGEAADSNRSTVRLYERTSQSAGWMAESHPWAAHNALRGWTDDHHSGDLRSPIGVFTLTAAGGRLSNPGTALPYTRSSGFTVLGTGFEGEPLAGSFDYVVAIDYNHVPGTSPLDWTRPLGDDRGGGIWLHVDHGGPTHGCVSLPKADMVTLLRALDPAEHPVVVMGPAAALGAE
jgi:L,D-peptidoglycan transpeptidase YkuD (ErfK/YbiS/YcfS/YnhG family)